MNNEIPFHKQTLFLDTEYQDYSPYVQIAARRQS